MGLLVSKVSNFQIQLGRLLSRCAAGMDFYADHDALHGAGCLEQELGQAGLCFRVIARRDEGCFGAALWVAILRHEEVESRTFGMADGDCSAHGTRKPGSNRPSCLSAAGDRFGPDDERRAL